MHKQPLWKVEELERADSRPSIQIDLEQAEQRRQLKDRVTKIREEEELVTGRLLANATVEESVDLDTLVAMQVATDQEASLEDHHPQGVEVSETLSLFANLNAENSAISLQSFTNRDQTRDELNGTSS